jgi:two-component system response regulator VicR
MCLSFSQILYVDGDPDSCEIVRLLLKQMDNDYEITTLTSAEEAFDLISRKSFDLYIFDQPWRKPSGLELCQKVRQADPEVPILVFSVMSREVDRKKAFAAGANEYLVKADDINRLAETVKRLLAKDIPVLQAVS